MFNKAEIRAAALLGAGHLGPTPAWQMKAHHHAFHEFIVVMDGAMTVTSRDRDTLAAAGDVLLYPAGMVHAERTNPGRALETHFFSFTCAGLSGPVPVKVTDAPGRIRQMAAWLHSDHHASSPAVRAERDALLQAMLAEFLRRLGTEDLPLVARTRRYVRQHIAEPISLDDLARVNGISKFHFLRLYRLSTHRTPMQDVRAMRAEHARELILSTNLPLKDIAPRAGLGDEYCLSRLFRRVFRTPPGQYRRFHREA